MAHNDNKYTVNSKIASLQTRVTELESALKAMRVTLLSELQVYLDVHCHGMNGVDGRDGRDGVDGQSIVGPKGERGDVLVVGETELAKEVIKLRIKLKEQHATFLAHLIEGIEANRGPHSSSIARILAMHLEGIKQEIERLR